MRYNLYNIIKLGGLFSYSIIQGVCLAKDQKAWKTRKVVERTKSKANNATSINVTTLCEGGLGALPQNILKNLL